MISLMTYQAYMTRHCNKFRFGVWRPLSLHSPFVVGAFGSSQPPCAQVRSRKASRLEIVLRLHRSPDRLPAPHAAPRCSLKRSSLQSRNSSTSMSGHTVARAADRPSATTWRTRTARPPQITRQNWLSESPLRTYLNVIAGNDPRSGVGD